MLDAGSTKRDRKKLSEQTGIPIESILELVKLSNLVRIHGLKKKRARLYCEAGRDTLEKIARWDSEKMRKMLTANL